MNFFIMVSLFLSAAVGVFRGIDLALLTDAETGLCIVGPVWLRYGALAVAVGAAVAAGRCSQPQAGALRGRCTPSGVVALAAAVCYGEADVLRILWMHSSVVMLIRAALEALCAFWMIGLGLSWLRRDWKTPTRSLTPAVLGSAVFYWCVLARFMENSSSWHRVEPTAMVWQMLAALVFLSAMVRALWLPETSNGCQLCEAGICTFLLCFCWELPRVLVLLFHGITAADLPEVLFGFGMCCIGALGLFTVARVAGSDGRPAISRHAVG